MATLEAQVTQLQQQLGAGEKQVDELKGALGMAMQSQAMTDDQKSQLEEAKRAVADAQERGKLAAELQDKLKNMIDAGNLKVATRHGRVVLQLHDDVLFDKGEADVKAEGKQAISEVAATLRQVAAKRFQIAGHTDNAPITTGKKKEFPTNWELSAARAIAVVKQLVSEGVDRVEDLCCGLRAPTIPSPRTGHRTGKRRTGGSKSRWSRTWQSSRRRLETRKSSRVSFRYPR